MIELETRLKMPTQVMTREVSGETVLLDLSSGTYFGLDELGTRIWTLIGEGRTLADILAIITDEYEVDEARAREDLIALVGELVERGLLDKAS